MPSARAARHRPGLPCSRSEPSPSVSGQLPVAGEEDWLQVTFNNEGNKAFHGHIVFTTNPNGEFAFDVDANCAPAPLACGEGGGCTGKTEWEVF